MPKDRQVGGVYRVRVQNLHSAGDRRLLPLAEFVTHIFRSGSRKTSEQPADR